MERQQGNITFLTLSDNGYADTARIDEDGAILFFYVDKFGLPSMYPSSLHIPQELIIKAYEISKKKITELS